MTGLEKYLIGIIVVDTVIAGILVFKNRQLEKALKMERHNLNEMHELWKRYTGAKGWVKGAFRSGTKG